MKKTLLIFLLLPLLAAAQKPAGWLTPYADATFENGKIVYTVSRAEIKNNPRLLPLMLPKNLVSLCMDNSTGAVSSKYIAESQSKIRNYLATEPAALRSTQEQSQYLRLAAMAVLWDLDLDKHCVSQLQKISASSHRTLAKNADIVLRVREIFLKNKRIKK